MARAPRRRRLRRPLPAERRTAGDRLPSLPDGEPILPRWFVLAMLALGIVGLGVVVWAFLRIDVDPIPVAERRPTGSATVTHDRGDAVLNTIRELERGPACAAGVTIVGDAGARAAGRRALGALCQQLALRSDLAGAQRGLEQWVAAGGTLRFAVFERSGVDSSARIEAGRPVIELNARFQFEDATEAAPFVAHELVHLATAWPGRAVDAAGELEAMEVQRRVCAALVFRDGAPRGCGDAAALAAMEDPIGALRAAGYGPATAADSPDGADAG